MKTEKVVDHIVSWLVNYCDNAKMKGFVVGVSGGIDSALTSTLCAKTGRPVWALNLPILQDPAQVSLSAKHIAWLTGRFDNVRTETVDLSNVLASLQDALPDAVGDTRTLANTRSRLRMVTLYVFASHYSLLVAGTGNKVEDFGVGFYTKYGDGGVDLSPIADLVKTEVYEAARHLGVIQEILDVPPTDGLWPDNRTDESQIGATYPELEWAMAFDATGEDPSLLSARRQEVLAIYRRFHRANRHKMDPIPVCQIPNDLR
ncbi:NAD(+) synthase [Desulfosudis oleivorans]|uniref:NH(3)-dependent NAD(+) synthetase n=1 Tax=Desulfosudis oleivorans (strain DSM 6200 / JCM 39069 / Hxd3) TaxID=96561 RepID=A8ZU66_DESOH|nr:NAD(+) synthase [Desulfosudis oleivorans]ABW66378.1 NAD+ synthetase [Desulfosudis oleivorans Hxd3]